MKRREKSKKNRFPSKNTQKIENQNYTWTLSEKDNKLSNNAKLSAVALFAKCAYIFKNYHNFDENRIFEIIKKYRGTNGYV